MEGSIPTPSGVSIPGGDASRIAAQCRVVAHLAQALAVVSTDMAGLFEAGVGGQLIEPWDSRSYRLMEMLGNALNDMDATDREEDEWTDPIFAAAHEAHETTTENSLGTPEGVNQATPTRDEQSSASEGVGS